MTNRGGGFSRSGGRSPSDLRPVTIELDAMKFAEGSALIGCGDTRVLCSASIERRVPPFLVGKGQGWLTAEYAMLPRATLTRSRREVSRGRPSGRTAEIQRLIGRSLRSAVNLKKLPEVTIAVDCDVIQADGGTRTASITGAYVALACALAGWADRKTVPERLLKDSVAAVSVGVVDGEAVLDLNAAEDNGAEVDMNFVMTGSGRFVEVQGTAEKQPFSAEQLSRLIGLAQTGIERILEIQQRVLREWRAPS